SGLSSSYSGTTQGCPDSNSFCNVLSARNSSRFPLLCPAVPELSLHHVLKRLFPNCMFFKITSEGEDFDSVVSLCLVLSRSKSTERVTASDIESDDDDQQHTNGASVPVQALDREANGVPLDATVINARGCKGTGGKRIAQRRVYGP
ncbi:hypothetical protein D6D18_09564, partial [Aureobasidium pullulans]